MSSRSVAGKIVVVAVVLAAIGAVVAMKVYNSGRPGEPGPAGAAIDVPPPNMPLPAMMEFGAGKCAPCKSMEPILAGLRRDFAWSFRVVEVNVDEDPQAQQFYEVRFLPTQVFLDANGSRLDAHEGPWTREEILAHWKKLGYDFKPGERGRP